MSDLREQAERMLVERLGIERRFGTGNSSLAGQLVRLVFPAVEDSIWVASGAGDALWSECVRLQVELLAEKESK